MSECFTTLAELRQNIDLIDEQIIKLLANRYQYVKHAVKFKQTEAQVADPKRVDEILLKIEKLAIFYGLPSEIAHLVYTNLINGFISLEKKQFRDRHNSET